MALGDKQVWVLGEPHLSNEGLVIIWSLGRPYVVIDSVVAAPAAEGGAQYVRVSPFGVSVFRAGFG